MHVVTVPTTLDDRSLDQLAEGLAGWPPPSPLLIDARGTTWSSPVGFVSLLTLGQALADLGVPKPRFALPEREQVTSYWAKAGLLDQAEQYFTLHGRGTRRRVDRMSDVLVPVAPIRSIEDVHAIVGAIDDQLTEILKRELVLDASVVGGFLQSLAETAQNVIEHSGSTGWVASHVYNFRRRLGRKAAVIAVSDGGVGFRRSLEASQARRFGERWSDGVAIETALIHSVSRFRDPSRGLGLASTKRYLSRWQGKISVRSGTARVALAPAWDDEPARSDDLAFFPGAQVTIVIPAADAAA